MLPARDLLAPWLAALLVLNSEPGCQESAARGWWPVQGAVRAGAAHDVQGPGDRVQQRLRPLRGAALPRQVQEVLQGTWDRSRPCAWALCCAVAAAASQPCLGWTCHPGIMHAAFHAHAHAYTCLFTFAAGSAQALQTNLRKVCNGNPVPAEVLASSIAPGLDMLQRRLEVASQLHRLGGWCDDDAAWA